MPGERDEKGGGTPQAPETQKTEAFPIGAGDDPDFIVERHLRTAARFLHEGSAGRAFSELVQASRSVPMTRRLAAAVVRIALRAGSEAPAVTLLNSGIEENEGAVRLDIRRQLARIARKRGDLDRAREVLVLILAEKPGDRRARFALNALLEREERWEELDASLDREVKDHLRRGALRRAARATLARARLWGERLSNHSHAALRYMQAAQYLEQSRDFEGAFNLRVLWLRSLREAQAPAKSLLDAVDETIKAGERVGKGQRARTLVREMGLSTGYDLDPFSPEPSAPGAPARRNTQRELLAAAEEAAAKGKAPEAAALFAAAVDEAPEAAATARLEAHYVARGAWRELAYFYRDRAAQAGSPKERAELLTRMAEVLEDELRDVAGAAKAYGEIVQLTGDRRALIEQVRLLSSREDQGGVRRALDLAVEHAPDPVARANALVARADAGIERGEHLSAKEDYEEALRLAPGSLAAMAGLAEIFAATGNFQQTYAFRDALSAVRRREAGRVELLRRLARLSDGPLADTEMSSWAWAEILADAPQDPQAQQRVAEIARRTGDDAQLEQALRAQLEMEPRGEQARSARLELIALLERLGRADEVVAELRQAVGNDPAHKEAWLALAERLEARNELEDAASALEQAASATDDEAERVRTWERLAAFYRERLGDADRAEACQARADKLKDATVDTHPPLPPEAEPPGPPQVADVLVPAPALAQQLSAAAPTNPGLAVIPGSDEPEEEPKPPVATSAVRPRAPEESEDLGSPDDAALDEPQEPLTRPAPALDPEPPTSPSLDAVVPTSGPEDSWRREPNTDEHALPLRGPPTLDEDEPPAEDAEDAEDMEGELAEAADDFQEEEEEGEEEDALEPHEPESDPMVPWEIPAVTDPGQEAVERGLRARTEELDAEDEESGELEEMTGDVELLPTTTPGETPSPDEPIPDRKTDERQTAELPAQDDEVSPHIVSPSGPSQEERQELFQRVRENPLNAEVFRELADFFDLAGDVPRSALMQEISAALEGDPAAAPRAPKLILSATDRAGLRHPSLRNEAGELLSLAGIALCELFPAKGRAAGSNTEFRLDSGKGSEDSANALLAAVRVLGLRAPDVYLSEENGPPFSLVYTLKGARVLVGRAAVRKQLPDAELRFFAGRALFSQNPDLMVLRSLKLDQLEKGLALLEPAVRSSRPVKPDARALRQALPEKVLGKVRELLDRVEGTLRVEQLMEGARHSANRAGLVVCGGVAPALAALRAKKALDTEVAELVRFAASERYLQLRARHRG